MGLKTSQRQLVAKIEPTKGLIVNGVQMGPHGTDYGPSFNSGNDAYYFSQVSGGEITASVERVYSGGNHQPEVLCAPMEIGDITITGYFEDSGKVFDNIQTLRQLVGRCYYDIDVFILDCGLRNPASQRLYSNALLVGITEPEGDASSGAPTTFALTFAVTNVSGKTSPAKSS